jgi:outer membrane receptor for ferrienterochelin and colicins
MACLGCTLSAAAQDSVRNGTVEQVVVTGQYSPNNPEKAVQRIKIIDRTKIDLMAAQNLADVLTNELNVRLSKDNILGSGLSINGLSGSNIKILIDGVPIIGRQNGNIDISQVNLFNIERIEIVEGPMSVIYGTDALGGAINLISRKNQKNTFEGGLTTYYETIGTYNLTGRLGYRKGKHFASLNAGRNFFDGWNNGEELSFDYSPKLADYTRFFVSKPREQYFSNLQYIYTIGKTSINYKGDIFKEKITNRGLPKKPYYEEADDDYYHTQRLDNAIFVSSYFKDNSRLNILASYNYYTRVKNTYTKDLTTLEEVLSPAEGIQDTTNFDQFNSRGTYSDVIGKRLNYEAGYDINIQNGTGRRIKNNRQSIGDYAAYVSAEYRPVANLTIRPGFRYAYNTSYDAPLIPTLHIRYKLLEGLTARASFSKGFRAPDLKELYFYFYDVNHNIKGNEDLRAEYSNSYNASVGYSNKLGSVRYGLDISGAYNDVRDLITLAATGVGMEYTYVNIGVYKTHALQAGISIATGGLSVSVGGSYTGLYNELSQTESTVSAYSYASEMRTNISYGFKKAGLTAALFYKYTGKLPGYAVDEHGIVQQIFLGDYHTGDLTLTKSFVKGRYALGAGCKNLFNVKNVGAFIASQGAHTASGDSYFVGNGRLYFLKLDVNLIRE